MREAVLAELNRLRQMLQTPVAVDDAAADPTTGRNDAALLDFGPEYAPVASSPGPTPAASTTSGRPCAPWWTCATAAASPSTPRTTCPR